MLVHPTGNVSQLAIMHSTSKNAKGNASFPLVQTPPRVSRLAVHEAAGSTNSLYITSSVEVLLVVRLRGNSVRVVHETVMS